ncbi:MAG: hypothetical protein K2M20_03100 [Lachnospiraceae bacterium]|nr:hypothetical protein [Lachnospiraceae bacterium]
MNIGNNYASWMHNTPQTGYGSRSGQAGRTGTGNPFFGENEKNDVGVTSDATAGKTEEEEKSAEKNTENMTYREQILAHMEEMAKKVKEGKVEPTFQTGAQSFTIKEWEKLLADFDDAEEALQEQIKELIAEVEKQAAKEALRREAEGKPDSDGTGTVVTNVSVPEAAQPTVDAGGSVANPGTSENGSAAASQTTPVTASGSTAVSGEKPWEIDNGNDNCTDVEVTDPEKLMELLTGEVTKSTFPTDDPRHKHWFITCYGQDGIRCKEAYFDGTKWVNKDCWNLSYTEPGQYEKVMAFLQRFPQDANLRFACHENFWKDFLAGEIDEDDFVNFFETSTDKDGVPDYTYEKDGSTYIDREKAKYAKYMNGFGARFYTAEEMDLIWRAVIHENSKGLQKISDYDGQMTVPEGGKTGEDGEENDLKTQIITKPDGSTVLQIETNFGVMEVEIAEAQKFGLQYEARSGAGTGRTMPASPFAHTGGSN